MRHHLDTHLPRLITQDKIILVMFMDLQPIVETTFISSNISNKGSNQ